MVKIKPLNLRALFVKPSVKKIALGIGALLGIFILINVTVLAVYHDKTYPNTKLNMVKIGSVSDKQLDSFVSSPKFFPSQLTLRISQQTYRTTPQALGISENKGAMESSLKKQSWLPVDNLFISHRSQIVLKVNKKQLSSLVAHIASLDNVAPVGAKISLVNNKFSIVSSNNGFSINQLAAASVIVNDIKSSKNSVVLPLKPTTPSVTEASLASNLKSLESAVNTNISYAYNGRSSSPSASDITSWYEPSGDSFVLSSAKVTSYIKSVGQADGISVANVGSLVSSTESALAQAKPMSLSLQAVPNTNCSSNGLSELVLVSISARHLWACSGSSQVYDSAVVTGDEQHLDTLTPVGTYHIYAKETDRTLTGSDENGSWHDFVNYWMPFLYNQYGAYGFHDATWRPANAFGNIDPNTSNASNGCVELPLNTAKWLFSWDYVGTTVVIEN